MLKQKEAWISETVSQQLNEQENGTPDNIEENEGERERGPTADAVGQVCFLSFFFFSFVCLHVCLSARVWTGASYGL